MDRIRTGLIGLGIVFLITAVASLLFAPSPVEQAQVAKVKEPGEPLSQLGVAPNTENEAVQAAKPVIVAPEPPIAESGEVSGVANGQSMVQLRPQDQPVEI